MLRLFGYLMLLGFLSLSWAARPAAASKKGAKKPAGKTAAKKSGTSRSAISKSGAKSASKGVSKGGSKSGARRASASRTSGRRTASWRSRQSQPTAERYKQIQEALAAKGYLKPEDATGAWNADSIDAMKRFQADQKIEGAGKINSLSLIALGLGPKRENLAAAKPPAQPQPPPPPGQ